MKALDDLIGGGGLCIIRNFFTIFFTRRLSHMKKLFFMWVIIALIFSTCMSWADDSSVQPEFFPSEALEALEAFGPHMTYQTNSSVVLRSGEKPYYANVTSYDGRRVSLAGLKKNTNYYGDLPYGTLTVISGDDSSSGSHYPLMPSWGFKIIDYTYAHWDILESLAGQRVMWNIYASPDVFVGSMTVPEASEISIPVSGIVPCVELITDESGQAFNSAKIFFTEFGKTESVDTKIPRLHYMLTAKDGNSLRNETWIDFSGEVVTGVELPEDDFGNITIEYDIGLTTYIWTFEFMGVKSTYEFGLLDDEKPLKLKYGETKEITIKLPSTLEGLEVNPEDNNLNVGIGPVNSEVLGRPYISYDIGGFSWNGDLTSNDKKTSITFHLHGDNPGRTALTIDTPDNSHFVREVWVTDEDGNLPEQDGLPDLHTEVSVHESHA